MSQNQNIDEKEIREKLFGKTYDPSKSIIGKIKKKIQSVKKSNEIGEKRKYSKEKDFGKEYIDEFFYKEINPIIDNWLKQNLCKSGDLKIDKNTMSSEEIFEIKKKRNKCQNELVDDIRVLGESYNEIEGKYVKEGSLSSDDEYIQKLMKPIYKQYEKTYNIWEDDQSGVNKLIYTKSADYIKDLLFKGKKGEIFENEILDRLKLETYNSNLELVKDPFYECIVLNHVLEKNKKDVNLDLEKTFEKYKDICLKSGKDELSNSIGKKLENEIVDAIFIESFFDGIKNSSKRAVEFRDQKKRR